jgi:predicted nucleic acid-binding protein
MRVYLDVCCLNRPFDDQTQDRLRLESEAVLLVLSHVEAGDWEWIASDVVEFEIERTPDRERRHRVRLLTAEVDEPLTVEPADVARAQQLETLGFRAFDALHVACAERGGADVLLTTDDRFLRLAKRFAGQLRVRVENPLVWLEEIAQR